MKKQETWLALLAIAFCAFSLFACTQSGNGRPQATVNRQADEAAIRAVIASNGEASTARNAQGVAATYTADGDAWIAGLGSAPTVAHEGVAKLEKSFDDMPGFQSWKGSVDKIRFIARDAAIAEVTGITTMDSGKYPEKTTIVLARSTDGWKIAAWRVMDFDPALLKLMQH